MTNIKTGTRIYAIVAALLYIMAGHVSILHAKDLAVLEDRISSSPPDEGGIVTISGDPGSVLVSPNAIGTFSIENPGSGEKISGTVNPDGSFLGRIRGGAGDKLKITLMTSTDARKKIKKKVPQSSAPPLSAPPSTRARAVYSGGQRTEPARQFPDPTPEIVIRYKGAPGKNPAVRAGRPIDPEAEVLESGVLPPQ